MKKTFRLKLTKEKPKDQSQPQTEVMTIYNLRPNKDRIDTAIRLEDTPGFDKDEEISKEMSNFLKEKWPRLNGICFNKIKENLKELNEIALSTITNYF